MIKPEWAEVAQKIKETIESYNPDIKKFGGIIITKMEEEKYFKFYIVGVKDWEYHSVLSDILVKTIKTIEETEVRLHGYIAIEVRHTYGMQNELVLYSHENENENKKDLQAYQTKYKGELKPFGNS